MFTNLNVMALLDKKKIIDIEIKYFDHIWNFPLRELITFFKNLANFSLLKSSMYKFRKFR